MSKCHLWATLRNKYSRINCAKVVDWLRPEDIQISLAEVASILISIWGSCVTNRVSLVATGPRIPEFLKERKIHEA